MKAEIHYLHLLCNYFGTFTEIDDMRLKKLRRNPRFMQFQRKNGGPPSYSQLLSHFRNEKLLESMQCALCLENETDTVFLSCGHCCCAKCTQRLRYTSEYEPLPSSVEDVKEACFVLGIIYKKMFLCPFCRGTVTSTINFFP